MLIHRPDEASFNWWKDAGGFNIHYPSYTAYINDDIMKREITWQNQAILRFAEEHKLEWRRLDSVWIKDVFGHQLDDVAVADDIRVTILK